MRPRSHLEQRCSTNPQRCNMISDNNNEKTCKDADDTSEDIEWMPPEGGWGCAVVVGFSLVFIVVTGPMSSMGIVFKDFFEKSGDSTSGLTMINGVYNAVVSFTGFMTSFTLKRFSMRQVGVLGSLLFVLGTLLTVFTMSVPYLVFVVGVIQGVGFGIMMPICLTTFNNYFVMKRVAYMGVSSVLVGGGIMAYPIGIKYLMENYGFRGTLAILGGISCHAILAMTIMQPVEWHLVPKIKRSDASSSDVAPVKSDLSLTMEKVIGEKAADLSTLKIISEIDGDTELLEKREPLISIVERKGSLSYSEMFGSCKEIVDHYSHTSNLAKASSLASLGNWTSVVVATEAVSTKSGKWQTFINSFDLRLLKDPKYSNICFGISFAFFSDVTFFVLEPTLLYHYGFTQVEVALCITAGAAADLIFRAVFAIYTFRFNVDSRTVFFLGTCCSIVLRIAFMQYDDFQRVMIFTALLGMFRSWLHVFLPLVFAESCTNEQFPTAYGLFMMMSGIITFLMSVIVGVLRDYTNSIEVAFHFLTMCCFLLVIPWTIEFYYNYKNKRKSTK